MKKVVILILFSLFLTGCSSTRKPLVCENLKETGSYDLYHSVRVSENNEGIESFTIIDKYVIRENFVHQIDDIANSLEGNYTMYSNVKGIIVDKEKKNNIYTVTVHMDINNLDPSYKELILGTYKNAEDVKKDLENDFDKYKCSYKY